jgi:imidazole glycerol phosphate synthase glutamine amidotransferase subunit
MSAAPEVVVVRTGTANLASVLVGLERVGAAPRITEDPADAERAERLVLPGVGTLAAALEHLRAAGLERPLAARVAAGRPTLAICLGLQLLCEESAESPGQAGLGAVPGRVTRFGDGVRVPQLGWNRIGCDDGCALLEPGHVYFANSYKLDAAPPGWRAARADYGGEFVAALERGPVLACQFHPELSGRLGLRLLARWLDAGAGNDGGATC